MKLLSKLNLKLHAGETCILRVDLNVVEKEFKDNFRLKAILPTINYLLANDIRVVILSHYGRPDDIQKNLSLSPFGPFIAKAMHTPVDFIAAYRIGAIKKAISSSDAKIILLENLRFFNGEDANDSSFARQLASLGDFYVNDAFAVSHRTNASVVAITKYIPAFAGLLMEREINGLSEIIKKQTQPFVMIVGGAKISDKMSVVRRFARKIDAVLAGGGPANTFFAAQNFPLGKSLVDWNSIPLVRDIYKRINVVLPTDVVVKKGKILDIGPETIKLFSHHISKARTIIWAGPLGYFTIKGCENGTRAVWQALLSAGRRKKKVKIIVGGGETTASLDLIKNAKVPSNIFISTGGGAMLQFLAGEELPGIKALK